MEATRMQKTVVLFHSALGLNDGVRAFAESLRMNGNTVHVPDLFDGDVFTNLEDGVRKRDETGIPLLSQRAAESVKDMPNGTVYAGFSMGAASAQYLAGTISGAGGAVLMHAALPNEFMGIQQWPTVPVQIHFAVDDPWVQRDHVRALSSSVEQAGAICEVFEYPGSAHLFADASSPDYNEDSATKMLSRVLTFLSRP
jgi:dienelactone hydrolase